MRAVGTRRGNTMVRFLVDQTARRRLWASGAPSQLATDSPPSDHWSARWTPRFLERIHRRLIGRMCFVDALPEGELRWYGGAEVRLWCVTDAHHTVLALDHGDTPAQIRERARRWRSCLSTRTAPGLASPHWGHPVYGARLDQASGELDVVWAVPGEWCALVLGATTPEPVAPLPEAWRTAEV